MSTGDTTVTVTTGLDVHVPAPGQPRRKALAGHLTYRGNCTHMAVDGQVVGPNMLGERLVAVTAHYDHSADKTRVGFDYAQAEGLS